MLFKDRKGVMITRGDTVKYYPHRLKKPIVAIVVDFYKELDYVSIASDELQHDGTPFFVSANNLEVVR